MSAREVRFRELEPEEMETLLSRHHVGRVAFMAGAYRIKAPCRNAARSSASRAELSRTITPRARVGRLGGARQ